MVKPVGPGQSHAQPFGLLLDACPAGPASKRAPRREAVDDVESEQADDKNDKKRRRRRSSAGGGGGGKSGEASCNQHKTKFIRQTGSMDQDIEAVLKSASQVLDEMHVIRDKPPESRSIVEGKLWDAQKGVVPTLELRVDILRSFVASTPR